MLGSLIKRKIDTEKFSNVFVNSMLQISDTGFEDLCEMIREDSAFVSMPKIDAKLSDQFLLILISGNLNYLSDYFETAEIKEVKKLIIQKFALAFDVSPDEFEQLIEDTKGFISQVNHPSKNMRYGMSKAIFHQFELNQYQEDYFRSMKTPNPLFLKRMDDIMQHFLWNWDQFFRKHKFHLN